MPVEREGSRWTFLPPELTPCCRPVCESRVNLRGIQGGDVNTGAPNRQGTDGMPAQVRIFTRRLITEV